jgi:hypothetical protein
MRATPSNGLRPATISPKARESGNHPRDDPAITCLLTCVVGIIFVALTRNM